MRLRIYSDFRICVQLKLSNVKWKDWRPCLFVVEETIANDLP